MRTIHHYQTNSKVDTVSVGQQGVAAELHFAFAIPRGELLSEEYAELIEISTRFRTLVDSIKARTGK